MSIVSKIVEDKNAEILMGVFDKFKDEFIDCAQIAYYVDEELQFKSTGKIMINENVF